jgi:hypothetical protein
MMRSRFLAWVAFGLQALSPGRADQPNALKLKLVSLPHLGQGSAKMSFGCSLTKEHVDTPAFAKAPAA